MFYLTISNVIDIWVYTSCNYYINTEKSTRNHISGSIKDSVNTSHNG